MKKVILFVFWSGVSKKGNTSVLLSTTQNTGFERVEVKHNGKTLKQIIMKGDDGSDVSKDKTSYVMLFEGDVTADFPDGSKVECILTKDVISVDAKKGALVQALMA
jgi:hypothetical protein